MDKAGMLERAFPSLLHLLQEWSFRIKLLLLRAFSGPFKTNLQDKGLRALKV